MLDVVYFSNVSENTARFVERLQRKLRDTHPIRCHRIPIKTAEASADLIPEDWLFMLIVPAYGTERNGHVPPQVKKFLANTDNRNKCVAVVGTGNMNFGTEYALSGDVLAQKLGVPLVHKFELSGMDNDYDTIERILKLTPQQIQHIAERNINQQKEYDGTQH